MRRYLLDTGIMGDFINRRRGVAERESTPLELRAAYSFESSPEADESYAEWTISPAWEKTRFSSSKKWHLPDWGG